MMKKWFRTQLKINGNTTHDERTGQDLAWNELNLISGRVAGQRRGGLDAGFLHLDGGRGQVRLRPGRRVGLCVQGRPRLRA